MRREIFGSFFPYYVPLPWSGSVSSSPATTLGSSVDERLPEELKKEPQSADMMGEEGRREEV